jgi:hypothetical protein
MGKIINREPPQLHENPACHTFPIDDPNKCYLIPNLSRITVITLVINGNPTSKYTDKPNNVYVRYSNSESPLLAAKRKLKKLISKTSNAAAKPVISPLPNPDLFPVRNPLINIINPTKTHPRNVG